MSEINLFPIQLHTTSIVPNDYEYKILDEFLSNKFASASENLWALETGKSTGEFNLNLYKQPEAQWLMNRVMPIVQSYWQRLDYRRGAKIIFTSAWANQHETGQETGEHSHYGGSIRSHVSAVYYFKKPDNSGNIEFVDPLEYIRKMEPIHEYSEYTPEGIAHMYKEVSTEQFDLVLFPSWLKHRTQVNKSTGSRVAISMNFIGLY